MTTALARCFGGFPLKEVVGHVKAQSTCFEWAPGGRSGEAAAPGAESGAGFGVWGLRVEELGGGKVACVNALFFAGCCY